MDLLNHKKFKAGDLVYYSGDCSELDKKKYGLILTINPVLGSGFETADILWCDDNSTETVILNYLSLFSNKSM